MNFVTKEPINKGWSSDKKYCPMHCGSLSNRPRKVNERAIKFYEKYVFHFDVTEQEVKLGTLNTELRMIFEMK